MLGSNSRRKIVPDAHGWATGAFAGELDESTTWRSLARVTPCEGACACGLWIQEHERGASVEKTDTPGSIELLLGGIVGGLLYPLVSCTWAPEKWQHTGLLLEYVGPAVEEYEIRARLTGKSTRVQLGVWAGWRQETQRTLSDTSVGSISLKPVVSP